MALPRKRNRGKILNKTSGLPLFPHDEAPYLQSRGAVVFQKVSPSPKLLLVIRCHRVPNSTIRDSFFCLSLTLDTLLFVV